MHGVSGGGQGQHWAAARVAAGRCGKRRCRNGRGAQQITVVDVGWRDAPVVVIEVAEEGAGAASSRW